MAEINPDQYQLYWSSSRLLPCYGQIECCKVPPLSRLVQQEILDFSSFGEKVSFCQVGARIGPVAQYGNAYACPYAVLRQFFQNLVGNRDFKSRWPRSLVLRPTAIRWRQFMGTPHLLPRVISPLRLKNLCRRYKTDATQVG
jgi:hypothetical protein